MIRSALNDDFPVLPNDYGIRPAGERDQCFYCNQHVGEPHGDECVMIVRASTYEVWHGDKLLGLWTRDDPAHWTNDSCEFHKNDSSWCVDNADFDFTGVPKIGECHCSTVEFKLRSRSEQRRRATP